MRLKKLFLIIRISQNNKKRHYLSTNLNNAYKKIIIVFIIPQKGWYANERCKKFNSRVNK